MNRWQKSEDMRNRMNGMLLWLDKTQNVLGKDNDWKKIRNKLGFNNLGVSEKLFLEKVYVNQGAGEFAYQFAKMKTMQKQFEYMTSLRSINATRENILVKQFYQYSTWYLGFQKAVTKNLKHAMIKGDRINATKALATMTISGIFTKVMLETLFGTLPDDDDFLKRLGKSAIGYFDPTDYTGSWGASTMLSPINPFYIKGVISGRVSWKFPAEEIALGQSGVLIGQMITSIVNSYQIFFGDKKARENAIKQISNTVNTYGRQTLAPYILIERMLSLYSGSKRINVIRKIAEQTGVEYKPTKIEREWYEQIQFILTGKNPRQVKKKGKTISK